MSVVVRMEMPKNCWGCPCGQNSWIWGDDGKEKMVCFCFVDGNSEVGGHYILETDIEPKRPAWCPIICSLPEGHGRLIDADSMEKEVCGGCVHGEHKYANCIDCALANAPTIVPGERSET